MQNRNVLRALALAFVLVFVGAACGDDGGDAADDAEQTEDGTDTADGGDAAASGDSDEVCDILSSQEEPTEEDLQALRDASPEVGQAVDEILAAGQNAGEEAADAIQVITDYLAENCQNVPAPGGGGDGG